jgi:hypothetical protein
MTDALAIEVQRAYVLTAHARAEKFAGVAASVRQQAIVLKGILDELPAGTGTQGLAAFDKLMAAVHALDAADTHAHEIAGNALSLLNDMEVPRGN